MIRCDHCGWSNNPDGAVKCQKCNQELVYQPVVPSVSTPVEERRDLSACTKCGYPLNSESSFCPNCGAPSKAADLSMKSTVRDISAGIRPAAEPESLNATHSEHVQPEVSASFRLRPVDVDAPEAFAFNADADAAFEFADGQWFITDKSGTGSTYVCASRKIALMSGDVVLIGGRKYKFE